MEKDLFFFLLRWEILLQTRIKHKHKLLHVLWQECRDDCLHERIIGNEENEICLWGIIANKMQGQVKSDRQAVCEQLF